MKFNVMRIEATHTTTSHAVNSFVIRECNGMFTSKMMWQHFVP